MYEGRNSDTYQRRKSMYSLFHAPSLPHSLFPAKMSDGTNRCAADKNITGNELAYFTAFQSGRRLSFDGLVYSTMHCRKRTRYGRLGRVERRNVRWKANTYLINVGKIHLYNPYCFGGARRLPPGSSIQSDSQTSPSTFAYDVKMSAKTTSEKYTRWFMGADMHLLMLLFCNGKPAPSGEI